MVFHLELHALTLVAILMRSCAILKSAGPVATVDCVSYNVIGSSTIQAKPDENLVDIT